MTQVAPAAQLEIPQPAPQLPISHVALVPHRSILHPPPEQVPKRHAARSPSHSRLQPPGQLSMVQVAESPHPVM